MPFSSLLYPLAPNLQPLHPRLQPLNWRLHLLHQYLHPFLRLVTRLVTKLGTSWGHCHFTANITAIFTAIIFYIAWVQSPFMKEAKKFFAWQGCKAERGNIHSAGNKRKTYILRFKCDFCEKTTKIALKNGLNINWGEYSLCLSEGYKGEWAGLKKCQHWQKYKIGKLEEGSR